MSVSRWLHLILLLTLALGLVYAFVTPPFEASDELWHYPMVRHLADGGSLPVQDPANVGPWKQEASQPPLYYYLGAALTFWIDTSDVATARWLNPHVDNGVITPDGNINLAIHDPDASRWRGTLLAVTLLRVAGVLLGLGTVWLTFELGRLVWPERAELALGAAALNAFTPMFLFISGAVNNDNLAVPLTSLAVVIMARVVAKGGHVGRRTWIGLGVVVGLAALTKEGTLALIPLALGTAYVSAWQAAARPGGWRGQLGVAGRAAVRFLAVMVPVIAIAGWWYVRNVRLYGDWLGWSAFLAVLGQRAHPASPAQLWDERWGFLASYWGLFGGVNVPLPDWIYQVLNGLLVLAVPGFLLALWRRAGGDAAASRLAPASRGLPARVLGQVERHFPLVLCLLLSLAVVFGVIQWATVTWSSQGRLVFTAISALNILLASGLAGWLPARPAAVVLGAVASFLLLVSLLAPSAVIRPAYTADRAATARLSTPASLVFGDGLRLAAYETDREALQPGERLTVRLAWEVIAPLDRDWSVFVHLQDPLLGVPIAQRDMYPGQGLLATRLLRPGDRLVDRYVLAVPPSAIAPADLGLRVGLYDVTTGERLRLASGADAAELGVVRLAPRPGEVPNPLSVNFEDRLRLIGFDLDARVVAPGEELTLVLTLEATRLLDRDYTFFAQVLGVEQRRWAAADVPAGTRGWPVGERQHVELSLAVDAGTPPDVYPLIIGVYSRTPDGGFDRLQTVTPEGRLTEDFVTLTLVRVGR